MTIDELSCELNFNWRDEFGYAEFHLMRAIDAIRTSHPRYGPDERKNDAISHAEKALAFLRHAEVG